MPGANYMGGKRNAAKARVKDTTGRLEKSFFGQRRLCAASQAGRKNIPTEESLGGANISLGHAKRTIPPKNDVITSSFIPSPIDPSPSTPRSRRRTNKRLEVHSSSSNVGRRSKALDALDVSEPMFIRQVLDKILTMPDLAGISRNRTKPTVDTERRPQPSDESSPLQRTKRKRSASDLFESSDSLSDDYNMETTGIEIHDDGFSEFADDVQGDRSSTSSSQDYGSCRYSSSPKSPSSNYTPYSNFNSKEIMDWKESCPTSIVFRGLKNRSAKQFMTTDTYPVEEPTVYGALFEQADPWDTIGQILGLPNTKPSRSPGEVINDLNENYEIDRSEGSFETSSTVGQEETENTGTTLNTYPVEEPTDYGTLFDPWDTIGQTLGLPNTKPSKSSGELVGEVINDLNEIYEIDRSEVSSETSSESAVVGQEETENRDTGTALNLSPQIAQVSDEISKAYESALAIPELEELDGFFIGPSLFELDKDEDGI